MDRETLQVIETESLRTAWIGMVLFFVSAVISLVMPQIGIFGVLMFLLVWIGSGIVNIRIRRWLRRGG